MSLTFCFFVSIQFTKLKEHQAMQFISTFSEDDATYTLDVSGNDSNSSSMNVNFTVKFTDFFDTHGYMWRSHVKSKIIERMVNEIAKK